MPDNQAEIPLGISVHAARIPKWVFSHGSHASQKLIDQISQYGADKSVLVTLGKKVGVELRGPGDAVLVARGSEVQLDTGATSLALPHYWWKECYKGFRLWSAWKTTASGAVGQFSADEGFCYMRVYDLGAPASNVWPHSGHALVRACLLPKGNEKTAEARNRHNDRFLLAGLSMFLRHRICLHLDTEEPKGKAFPAGRAECDEWLGV